MSRCPRFDRLLNRAVTWVVLLLLLGFFAWATYKTCEVGIGA